jgi:hypothetical protein
MAMSLIYSATAQYALSNLMEQPHCHLRVTDGSTYVEKSL